MASAKSDIRPNRTRTPGKSRFARANEVLDHLGVGRALVVVRHPHAEPRLMRPADRWAKVRAIRRREHRQHARAIWPLPPVQIRNVGSRAVVVAAEVEELHARIGQDRGQPAGMLGHVGHFATRRKRLPGEAGHLDRVAEAARQVLQIERFGMRRERQGMRDQPPGAHGRHEPVATLRRLARPEYLRHRPAGQGPRELLVWRQTAALVDQLQGLIGHRRSVAVYDAAGEVREPDVEVRLGNHDHFFELRPPRSVLGPRRQRRADDPRRQQNSKYKAYQPGSHSGMSHDDLPRGSDLRNPYLCRSHRDFTTAARRRLVSVRYLA